MLGVPLIWVIGESITEVLRGSSWTNPLTTSMLLSLDFVS